MSDIVNTYKINDNTELRIIHDYHAESPRQWDNISTMICFHNRYNLGDEHDYNSSDFDNWSEVKEQIEKDHDVAVILPLYLYDHSGITISTSPFSCSWDSGQVGYIFITKEYIRSNYGIKRVTKKWIEKAMNLLLSEVKVYDQYLTGETYGFQVVEQTACNCGNVEENVIDSCWGFYGYDLKENGILEHFDDVQKSTIERQL